MPDIITADNVKFIADITYPDIRIPRCETTFIAGESGCGKSTLLKLFNGTVTPLTGVIKYNGKNINEYDAVFLRREILLAGQAAFLFGGSIAENFNNFALYRSQGPFDNDTIQKYLDICCLNYTPADACDNFSGGEEQRLFAAVCLAFKPKVLMLDEPTSALDSETADRLMNNIKAYCRENDITLICITHDMAIAEKYADNLIRLYQSVKV